MTTTHTRIIEKVFQGAAILAFSIQFFLHQTAFAQSTAFVQPSRSADTTPALQAHIFASAEPLVIKVIFVNPEKESITLLVKKDGKETVYTRKFENLKAYNSRIDVSALPDGNYTIEVIGVSSHFSETFEISTQIARLTSMQ